MGSSSHLKRLAMPRSWPLARKITTWVTRPRPGPHSLENCMPLNVVIRDVLEFARNSREVRRILHLGQIQVDGRIVRDPRRGVGLMDVLTVGQQHYRCLVDQNGRLRYRPIAPSDAEWKVCRIDGKATIKGGRTQLNLHDGRNILVDDPTEFSTGDSLKISLPDQEILSHIRFDDGSSAYLTGGSHVGIISTIKSCEIKRSSMPNEVIFDEFGTTERHVFVISGDTPLPGLEVSQ